jgi:hypothetical protein
MLIKYVITFLQIIHPKYIFVPCLGKIKKRCFVSPYCILKDATLICSKHTNGFSFVNPNPTPREIADLVATRILYNIPNAASNSAS